MQLRDKVLENVGNILFSCPKWPDVPGNLDRASSSSSLFDCCHSGRFLSKTATSTMAVKQGSAGENVRPDILAGIRNFLNGSLYREVIESSSQFNNGIVTERKLRLPYLDSQTGVAQSDCFLWMQKSDRMPGVTDGQLYSYPAKRWKKKRRQYLLSDSYLTRRQKETETFDGDSQSSLNEVAVPKSEAPETTSIDKSFYENSKDAWYQDYDEGNDLPDAGELDDPESDYDDYEEYGSRKKRKRKETPKRKRVEYSDAEKPYSCELCGARYKTRPGLSYHYSHSHQEGEGRGLVDEDVSYTPPRHAPSTPGQSLNPNQVPPPLHPSPSASNSAPSSGARASPLPPSDQASVRAPSSEDGFGGNRPPGKGSIAPPSDYCDFCLGDSIENKKTKSAEILVSCSDCGRSAHPTCLQFTANMITSVRKYRWQCIECKSCGLCGTSDNDVSFP